MATLSTGFSALIILDKNGIVCYASSNLSQVLGEIEIRAGRPLPAALQGWQAQSTWEMEINERQISVTAEAWNGHTILLISDPHSVYNEAATILNSIDEGIHVVNRRGQTVFYNPTMAKLEGMDYHQVINKNVLDMFPSLTPESIYPSSGPGTFTTRSRHTITTRAAHYPLNSTIPLWDRSSSASWRWPGRHPHGGFSPQGGGPAAEIIPAPAKSSAAHPVPLPISSVTALP